MSELMIACQSDLPNFQGHKGHQSQNQIHQRLCHEENGYTI